MELIGDSLSAGQYTTLEGMSSYAWGLMYGFGHVEFSITTYPGICLHDGKCYGNLRVQTYQWLKVSDTSDRAIQIYGDNPPEWNFLAPPAADITLINIGTNDNNTANNVTSAQFTASYIQLINETHAEWPHTQIIVLSLWSGFNRASNTWAQGASFLNEIQMVVNHFNGGSLDQYGRKGFVHYFDTTGILEHNDIRPQYNPTDFGHVKLASHLMQYIKLTIG
ncbi:hypothetical protein B0A48_18393 [Cryoendolithus antarcticus]|uniref:Uncharacterized protein n=1 Tax=Cryoendolithus antarcticus TaxID=1507870 RepID=A0A1V8S935_9PEZI|nr:hypothetical protein B0A48_18393 [Cryoendolithus antarcticus]